MLAIVVVVVVVLADRSMLYESTGSTKCISKQDAIEQTKTINSKTARGNKIMPNARIHENDDHICYGCILYAQCTWLFAIARIGSRIAEKIYSVAAWQDPKL